jgi:hypothetical protein
MGSIAEKRTIVSLSGTPPFVERGVEGSLEKGKLRAWEG